MIHELMVFSVRAKTRFDPPSKIVNNKELSCAIGMAYKELNLALPDFIIGKDIGEFINEQLMVINSVNINQNLLFLIKNYVFKNEVFDEDCLLSLKSGYSSGLK